MFTYLTFRYRNNTFVNKATSNWAIKLHTIFVVKLSTLTVTYEEECAFESVIIITYAKQLHNYINGSSYIYIQFK